MSSTSLEETRRVQTEVETALALVTSSTTDPHVVHFLRCIYTNESTNNSIHPLLAWKQWKNITKEQYLSILPALALASHMLTEPLTSNFINALIYCPTSIKFDNLGKPRKAFKWLCEDIEEPLRPAAQRRYEEALERLVPHVRLAPVKWPRNICAVTEPKKAIAGCGPGVQSEIQFSLERVNDVSPRSKSLDSLLLCYLELVQILLHELMHAIAFASDGAKYGERFFCDNTYVENGFSWEEAVLGGILELERRNSRDVILTLKDLDLAALVSCHTARNISFPVTSCEGLAGRIIREITTQEVMQRFESLLQRS
ncbi:hypothetical protein CKM354_000380800 [Cercospora kikuchii]|uniref:SprT-like domain-containing protein n=1 Tax=Cercospora kikuchii TaxID=84275 RepID=A0A9P3FE21_9PEZI|nr:uncharacterized protein CKM354_000380800 [Cercospora kikuchii]GIZ40472.1 hypothetical protein CKM354_000380800 [Cercospora kikuchii]